MVMLALAVLGACTTAGPPQDCPDDLPPSCPTPAPTFSADVAPLIQTYCAGCHSAGGQEPTPSLVNYSGITGPMGRTASDIEYELNRCGMPKPGSPQLTSEQRRTILGWIICGAQND